MNSAFRNKRGFIRKKASAVAVLGWLVCGWMQLGVFVVSTSAQSFRYVASNETKTKSVVVRMEPIERFPPNAKQNIAAVDEQPLWFDVRYGSEGSNRVLIGLKTSESGFELFVDSNRDRNLEKKEFVPGDGNSRRFKLDAELVSKGKAVYIEREVFLRLNSTGDSIGFGTVGYCEGRNEIEGESLCVRCIDGNANGLFGEAGDRVWIDANQDEKWSPFTEQFAFAPIFKFRGQRYSVKSDRTGRQFQILPLTDVGNIQLKLSLKQPQAAVPMINVVFAGEDGSVLPVDSLEPVEVPVGSYQIVSVRMSVQEHPKALPLHFTFASVAVGDVLQNRRQFVVTKDQTTVIDPLGKLSFEFTKSDFFEPGTSVIARPELFTEDRLLISSSHTGGTYENVSPSNFNVARLQFAGDAGRVMKSESVGFL